MWKVETTDDFDEWFAGLGIAEQDEIDAKVYLLKRMGPLLKRPHADTLKGSQYNNMKELRGKTPGSVIRIVFAFDPLKSVILLVGGSKRGVNEKRFYKQLIARADALYARHLARVEKRITDERAERKKKGN